KKGKRGKNVDRVVASENQDHGPRGRRRQQDGAEHDGALGWGRHRREPLPDRGDRVAQHLNGSIHWRSPWVAAAGPGSGDADVVEVPVEAQGAGLRVYETMIAAHAISHR